MDDDTQTANIKACVKRTLYFRKSVFAKEPYISANKLVSKEPYIFAKEPYIFAKEPYISANERVCQDP